MDTASSQFFMGQRVSEGSAVGPISIIEDHDIFESKLDSGAGVAATEWDKVEKAFAKAMVDLTELEETVRVEMGADKAEIFAAHKMIVEDPEIREQIKTLVFDEMKPAARAAFQTFNFFAEQFEHIDDPYLKERALDVKDVKIRILKILTGQADRGHQSQTPSIIIARDLTPSQFASLDKKKVLGIITEIGGATTHTAIMARLNNIPALVGVTGILEQVIDGQMAALVGSKKTIFINPPAGIVSEAKKEIEEFKIEQQGLAQFRDLPAVTTDQQKVILKANIGKVDDLDAVISSGAEGIGLFRTEFLFLEKTQPPTEEEQFQVYKTILEKVAPHAAIIRTLDVGGDKNIPFIHIPKEDNPFLGLRAIRYCLKEKTIFRTQIRALLRASVHGSLAIMFPMIATYEEVQLCKKFVRACEDELKTEKIQVGPYKVGIMIEIPAAAVIADQLASQVDFFSIGTNDLIQYVCAADRMNENVQYLYQPLNPAVLRLLKFVFESAEKNKIEFSICGEMASDVQLVPLLIGMGLRNLSQSPSVVLKTKKKIRAMDSKNLKTFADKILKMHSEEEIKLAVTAAFSTNS